jgi:hypothetical protein
MADDTRTTTPEDPLAWEARNARRAGLCAIAAGLCTLVGNVVRALAQSGVPNPSDRVQTLVDNLARTASGQPLQPGRVSAAAEYIGTHTIPFVIAGLLLGAGGLLVFPPLAYLFRAARARVPLNRLGLILAAVGAAGYGIGQALVLISLAQSTASFANGTDRSNEAANDALGTSTAAAAQLVRDLGSLVLAIAFVLISLAAMRAGLLTRFMGILGAIVGGSLVLQIDQLGIIRAFWLGAIGTLIIGARPERRPKAWSVAEAVPWPSQQQVREQREAARKARKAEARGGDAGGDADGDGARAEARERAERVPQPGAPQPRRAEPTGARPHPSSKKRKRKRR